MAHIPLVVFILRLLFSSSHFNSTVSERPIDPDFINGCGCCFFNIHQNFSFFYCLLCQDQNSSNTSCLLLITRSYNCQQSRPRYSGLGIEYVLWTAWCFCMYQATGQKEKYFCVIFFFFKSSIQACLLSSKETYQNGKVKSVMLIIHRALTRKISLQGLKTQEMFWTLSRIFNTTNFEAK